MILLMLSYGSDGGLTILSVFCVQAEDGIRDLVRSRGLGDVYKRQGIALNVEAEVLHCWRIQVSRVDREHRQHQGVLHDLSLIHI